MSQHRALPQARNRVRRVRLSEAVAAARAALETSRPDDPDRTDTALLTAPPGYPRAGLPAAELARRPPGLAAREPISANRPPRVSTALRGAARGLLGTPWFAAAAGFVVAASLLIYQPHPELMFPPSATAEVPCAPSGCGPAVAQAGSGSLAAASAGSRLSQPAAPAGHPTPAPTPAARTDTAVAGLAFSYIVLSASDGRFDVMISVRERRSIGNWKLSFVLPGDQISYVMGARWTLTGSDSLTAGALSGPSRAPGGRGSAPGDRGSARGGTGGVPGGTGKSAGQDFRHGVSFLVIGTGPSPAPAGCVYDGLACTFRS